MFSTLDCSPMGKRVRGGERKEIKKNLWPKQAIMHRHQNKTCRPVMIMGHKPRNTNQLHLVPLYFSFYSLIQMRLNV